MKGPPSKRKLDKARREGKLVRSPLLPGAIGGIVLLLVGLTLPETLVRHREVLEATLQQGIRDPGGCLRLTAKYLTGFLGAWLLLGVVAAVLFEAVRVGLVFSWSAITLDFSRLNHASGLMRIGAGLKKLWLVLLKVAVTGAVFYLFLKSEFLQLAGYHLRGEYGTVGLLTKIVIGRALGTGFALLLALGVLEFLLNRASFLKEMEMSPEEMKAECKEDEGDPLIKSHRRSLHRELSYQAMVKKIRGAKVIVVERAG